MTDICSSPRRSNASRNLADMLDGSHVVPQAAHRYLPAIPDTPQGPRITVKNSNKSSSALSRYLLKRNGLPSNDELQYLPTVPDTPAPSARQRDLSADRNPPTPSNRSVRAEKQRMGGTKLPDESLFDSPITSGSRPQPRSQTYSGLSRVTAGDATHNNSPRYPSQPAYPMLSSRQSGLGLNTARTPSGSSASGFEGVPPSARNGSSGGVQSPDLFADSPTTGLRAKMNRNHHLPSSRPDRQDMSTAFGSIRLPKGSRDASMLQDTSFGMLGGRDSLGSVGDDSWELPLGVERRELLSSAKPAASAAIASLANAEVPRTIITQTTSPTRTTTTPRKQGSPAKRRGGFTPAQALSESTLMPSPPKNAQLLESVNSLNRIMPPWAAGGNASLSSSFLDQTQVFPTIPQSGAKEMDKVRKDGEVNAELYPLKSSGSPIKASTMGGFLAPPVAARPKRSPSSCSRAPLSTHIQPNSLSSNSHDATGDMSTLLPVSALKHRHLLSDEHDLLSERLDMSSMIDLEGPSMFVPSSSHTASPTKSRPQSAHVDAILPVKKIASPARRTGSTPAKAPTTGKRFSLRPAAGLQDQTLDLKDMMATFRQPELPTGVEESYMDLINASMDDMDGQMMADETFFLPLDLRPAHPSLVRSKSLSRIETEKRITKIRASIAARDVLLVSPEKGLSPTRDGARTLFNSDTARDPSAQVAEVNRGRRRESGERSKRISLSAGPRLAIRREEARPVAEEMDADADAMLRANTLANGRFTSRPVGMISTTGQQSTSRSQPGSGASARSSTQISSTATRRIASGASTASASSRTFAKSSMPPPTSARSATRPVSMVSAPSAPRPRTGSTVSSARSAAGVAPAARMGSATSASSASLRAAKTSTGPSAGSAGIARSAAIGAPTSAASTRLTGRLGPAASAGVPAQTSVARTVPSVSTARSRPVTTGLSAVSTGRAATTRTFGSEASSIINRAAAPSVREGSKSAKTSMAPPPVPSAGSKQPIVSAQPVRRTATTSERTLAQRTLPSATSTSSTGSAPISRTRSTPAAVVAQTMRTAIPPRAVGTVRAAPTAVSSGSAAAARPRMPFRSDSDMLSAEIPASLRTAAPAASAPGYTRTGVPPRSRAAGSTGHGPTAGAGVSAMRPPAKLASGTGSVSRATAEGLADIAARLRRIQAQQPAGASMRR